MNNSQRIWSRKRVKTPTVLQMEAVECGAAALASVLAYHGRWVPLEELRAECGVSRDGSKASNVLKAARGYGLTAKGFRKEIDELRELPLPMILFWNFNHFVVLEGFKGGYYYINDPAQGPVKVTQDDFDQAFTGVVLSFEKGENFAKGGQRPNVFSSLYSRLGRIKLALAYAFLASLFLVIPGILVPTFSKIFVDNILVKRMQGWMQPLLLAMLMTAVVRYLLSWLQQHYLLRAEAKMALTSSARFFQHVFRLPMEFFSQRFGGEIGHRVQLNDAVAKLLSGDLATAFLNLVMIVFYAAVLFVYDSWLTVIGILIAAVNLVALRMVGRKRTDLHKRMLQDQGKLMGTTMSGLQMIETLKASGAESDFFSKWSGYQAKVLNGLQRLGIATSLLNVVPPTLMTMNTAIILTVGGFRVMDGYLTMGMLVAFQSLMSSFLNPVNEMVSLGSKLQTVSGDMARLDDVFNYPQDRDFQAPSKQDQTSPAAGAGPEACPDWLRDKHKLSGEIELANISFGYSKLEPALIQDLSLHLNPGQRVALVGGSGSGKSTIAKVISGLYPAWEGQILFDGVPRENIPRRLLSNSLAMVDQDIFLFEGSIRENLTMWDDSIPDKRVIRAGKDAHIHEDIAARPGGYDSKLAEDGGNFSGGQRQRIEIARALTVKPSIMLLDEATSALDPNTEKIIDDNLRRRGCTCIIVAHRLSTIRDCDEIIVLDQGKVVQRGPHDRLIEEEGHYRKLIEAE
ncbi:MAG: NHLP family bacteriocin export ABC transporter peptidase/permease/ATPase subunit [Desulfohalobiaceae bacterium]